MEEMFTGPWRRPFELAWEALLAGSFPIGAVLFDPEGEAVAEGRNRIGEQTAPAGQLAGTALAHAEMNVLAQMPPDLLTGHRLYTTLEPCLLCTSALRLARVGHVEYAAADPIWSGVDDIPSVLGPVGRRHWTARRGPMAGPAGSWGLVLLAIGHLLHNNADRRPVDDLLPESIVTVAVRCVDAGIPASETAAAALELAWPLLVAGAAEAEAEDRAR